MNNKNNISYLLKTIRSMVCIIATAYTAQAQCPSGPVALLVQDSTNYVNNTSTFISNNASLACGSQPIYIYVDKNTSDISMPCILSQYNVGFFDGGFCTSATETFYEGSIDLLCIGPSASCVYPIGGGMCPFTGSWGINKIFLDPGKQHNFQFCDNSLLNVSTTVQLQDCWSGAPLSPVNSFSVISVGNPCFTDSVLANTDIGTANFSIAPVSGTIALTDYHNGKAFINPALLSGGTTYTLTYTFAPPVADGCSPVTGTFKFTLASSPPVTVNSATICAGSSATLTASGASTYTWNTSATGSTITPSPTVTTTYTVTGATGICSSTKTTSVMVNATPTVTANATATTVCAGASITLTGGGANTYTWTSGVSNGVAFVPSSTQTYSVTGTDVNGCSNTATKTITVNPLPTVTANATATTLCTGASITLTGGGASTYTWTGGVSNGVAFVPSSTQTYTVTGTNVNGCTNTATKTITVNPLPTITANATATTVCAGASVTLTGGGASTYTWTGGVSNGVPFVPASTQTYTVTGTDVNGCTNIATKIITVNTLPTITANATATTVCAGANITLTGGGASTYTWTGGVSNGVPFAPPSTQTYTVTGTDINGCSNTATKTITVNAQPTASNAGPNQNICSTTTTLNANNPIVGSGTWSVILGGGTISSVNSYSSSITSINTGSNVFAWTITNGVCPPSTSTVSIHVDLMPSTSNAGSNQTICASTTTALSANAPTVGTGAWSVISGGGIITTTNSPASGVTNLSAGQNIFMWTISNGTCPASTSTVSINVSAAPSTSNAGPNQNICASTTTALSANTPSVGTGAWSVVSGGGIITTINSPTSSVTNLSTGQNIFMWTISNGTCPASTSTVSINISVMPTTANAGPDILLYSPNTNMNANTPLIGTGVWSVISGSGNFSNNSNPITQVNDLQFGQNIFMWTISNGSCPASHDEVIITLNELTVPNGFSPNGDHVNDNFEIPGLLHYTNVKLDVFNRWGNLVFQSNDYKNDWSGKNSSGEDLTDDTYYFTLEITGKKTYKGYIVLKRK